MSDVQSNRPTRQKRIKTVDEKDIPPATPKRKAPRKTKKRSEPPQSSDGGRIIDRKWYNMYTSNVNPHAANALAVSKKIIDLQQQPQQRQQKMQKQQETAVGWRTVTSPHHETLRRRWNHLQRRASTFLQFHGSRDVDADTMPPSPNKLAFLAALLGGEAFPENGDPVELGCAILVVSKLLVCMRRHFSSGGELSQPHQELKIQFHGQDISSPSPDFLIRLANKDVVVLNINTLDSLESTIEDSQKAASDLALAALIYEITSKCFLRSRILVSVSPMRDEAAYSFIPASVAHVCGRIVSGHQILLSAQVGNQKFCSYVDGKCIKRHSGCSRVVAEVGSNNGDEIPALHFGGVKFKRKPQRLEKDRLQKQSDLELDPPVDINVQEMEQLEEQTLSTPEELSFQRILSRLEKRRKIRGFHSLHSWIAAAPERVTTSSWRSFLRLGRKTLARNLYGVFFDSGGGMRPSATPACIRKLQSAISIGKSISLFPLIKASVLLSDREESEIVSDPESHLVDDSFLHIRIFIQKRQDEQAKIFTLAPADPSCRDSGHVVLKTAQGNYFLLQMGATPISPHAIEKLGQKMRRIPTAWIFNEPHSCIVWGLGASQGAIFLVRAETKRRWLFYETNFSAADLDRTDLFSSQHCIDYSRHFYNKKIQKQSERHAAEQKRSRQPARRFLFDDDSKRQCEVLLMEELINKYGSLPSVSDLEEFFQEKGICICSRARLAEIFVPPTEEGAHFLQKLHVTGMAELKASESQDIFRCYMVSAANRILRERRSDSSIAAKMSMTLKSITCIRLKSGDSSSNGKRKSGKKKFDDEGARTGSVCSGLVLLPYQMATLQSHCDSHLPSGIVFQKILVQEKVLLHPHMIGLEGALSGRLHSFQHVPRIDVSKVEAAACRRILSSCLANEGWIVHGVDGVNRAFSLPWKGSHAIFLLDSEGEVASVFREGKLNGDENIAGPSMFAISLDSNRDSNDAAPFSPTRQFRIASIGKNKVQDVPDGTGVQVSRMMFQVVQVASTGAIVCTLPSQNVFSSGFFLLPSLVVAKWKSILNFVDENVRKLEGFQRIFFLPLLTWQAFVVRKRKKDLISGPFPPFKSCIFFFPCHQVEGRPPHPHPHPHNNQLFPGQNPGT